LSQAAIKGSGFFPFAEAINLQPRLANVDGQVAEQPAPRQRLDLAALKLFYW